MARREYLAKTDRRYVKFKMKRIKRERNRGNRAAAERHANELLQYFGFDESERPIEQLFDENDEEDAPFRAKINKLFK